MSCPYANQQQRGGAGASDYVASVAGGPGQQQPTSQTDNYIKLRGGRRIKSKRRSILSRLMNIVGNRKRSKTHHRSSRKKHHRKRTYRK